MKTAIAALALAALAGTAFADIRETQTFAGPYQTYGNDNGDETNPLNQEFTATFTGTGYTPNGLYLQVDLTALAAGTYASEVVLKMTPPSGAPFYLAPAFDTNGYTTLTDVTVDLPLPAGVSAVGTWTVRVFDTYPDGGDDVAQSDVSNIRFSLQDLVIETPASTDLGTLGSADITSTDPAYNGTDVKWFKITLPDAAEEATGFYVDITTDGSLIGPGESETANDTVLAVFEASGLFNSYNDDYDYPESPWSSLSFGAGTGVVRTHSGFVDGFDGDLVAGTYYVAAAAYWVDFGETNFEAVSESTSAGGSLTLNVFSNFPGGPTVCSPADVGIQGGIGGHDNVLNNNDFIVFIDLFVAHDPAADLGIQGGAAGSDGTWDNNDFIAFIDFFFNDAANCNG